MNDFKNLNSATASFQEEWMLPLDEALGSLAMSISAGYVDKDKLKEELNAALNDPSFDWLNFAVSNNLIIVRQDETYTNDEIKNYFRSLIWRYLYPNSIDLSFIDSLKKDSVEILKNHRENNGWMSYEELWKELIKKQKYRDLDFLYLYFIDWGKGIEGKYNERNHISPGPRRYKQ